MSDYINFHDLLGVVIAGLIGGVGLVALFAVGVRGVDLSVTGRSSAGYAVAAGSFAIVAAGIVFGVVVLLRA